MIEVNGLYKSFDKFKALNGVNMHVEKGNIYGLVGPNGAGKSTLIRHLTGVYRADAGEILVDRQPVYENREIKEKIGNMRELKPREDGISNTITTVQKDNYIVEPKIICEQRCDEGLRFFKDNVCGTIRAKDSGGDKRIIEYTYKIRKLTPRECFRLMGLKDDDIDKIQEAGISNTQQYKMVGNSICIPVLEYIFKQLFKEEIKMLRSELHTDLDFIR